MAKEIKVGSHTVELSHADKVLFPDEGITKGDLIEYYRKVAGVMLPYLQNRPLNMHRFPDGINKEGFFQQEISEYFPGWIQRVAVKKEGGIIEHVLCQDASTLVYLANQACITFHVWLSRKDHLDYPDQLVFDLDPPDKDFGQVKDAARLLRKFLNELDLEPLVKTTGSRGLHVVVPLDSRAGFVEARGFARDLAGVLSKYEPEIFTVEPRKEKRQGRVLLDYARNSYGQTVVAPYAVRPYPGAPVAAPLDWDEFSNPNLGSQSYNLKNIFLRLSRGKDPWKGMWGQPYSLEKAQKKLDLLKKTA